MNFFLTSLTSLFITAGFYGILGSINRTDTAKTLWEIIIFSFLVGTLILTMTDKALKQEQKKYFPRIGSSLILSAMLILIGNGIKTFFLIINLKLLEYIGHLTILLGILFLSFLLASLFVELLKTILIDKVKK